MEGERERETRVLKLVICSGQISGRLCQDLGYT